MFAADQQPPRDTFPSRVHAFKPGESGNPAGRPPNAGLSVLEIVNQLEARDVKERELRAIASDESLSWSRRTAAKRMLRTLEDGDIADFQPVLSGKMTLEELRKAGVNTQLIKRCKQRTRVEQIDGEDVEILETELELHDRSGADFDRILDRTAGKPRQTMALESGEKPVNVTVEVLGLGAEEERAG